MAILRDSKASTGPGLGGAHAPNGAYREVNPSGQDDQGHAHRHDPDKGEVSRDVDDVLPLPELRDCHRNHQDHEDKRFDQVEARILGLTGSGAV